MIKNVLATQSLLDIWNSDTGNEDRSGNIQFPERIKLQEKLQDLLKSFGSNPKEIELIEEYQSNFKWEVRYTLNAFWEVVHRYDPCECYPDACGSIELPLEELNAYLDGGKEPPDPRVDWSEDDMNDNGEFNCELTGEYRLDASVEVRNLRPKWWDNLHSF